MTLFQPAKVSSAYLKMGIMGKQGAGKSKTAAKVAIGLVLHSKKLGIGYGSKPVAFFDTETGSDWLIPDFEAAGIPLVVAKSKTFAALLEAVKWAEKNASALIIDSITHPWRELLESYMKSKKRTYMQIDDWGYVKGDHGWAQFTDLFINSKLHIIMCGRAGDDLEQTTDDNGKRQLEKIGVKMKTEGETGFEPSLLVLMERNMNTRTNAVAHTATVLKDRSTRLDAAEFDDPDFINFLPHIELLNLGGDHVGVADTGDSQSILRTEKRDWQPVQRKIVHDEITTLLTLHYPGQTGAEKTARLKALIKHFDASWTEIEELMTLDKLRIGYDALYVELEGKRSKYADFVDALKGDMDDAIPEHGGAAPAIAPTDVAKPPLKDVLLGDLANLTTIADCVSWGMTVSNMRGLTADEHIELGKALMTRQNEIGKNSDQGGGGEDPEKNKPDDDKPGQMPPPQQEPTPAERHAAHAGRRNREKPAPVETERTMADLVSAG